MGSGDSESSRRSNSRHARGFQPTEFEGEPMGFEFEMGKVGERAWPAQILAPSATWNMYATFRFGGGCHARDMC